MLNELTLRAEVHASYQSGITALYGRVCKDN
ncbi:hypothetical protein FOFC_09834 [Fusarium oxysporum]|nr:hypothetical protein FOFC_09834 [Fusarium oxysporum]